MGNHINFDSPVAAAPEPKSALLLDRAPLSTQLLFKMEPADIISHNRRKGGKLINYHNKERNYISWEYSG